MQNHKPDCGYYQHFHECLITHMPEEKCQAYKECDCEFDLAGAAKAGEILEQKYNVTTCPKCLRKSEIVDMANCPFCHEASEEYTEQIFKNELEEILDEYFPKIYEEGPAKKANKRGEALMIFSTALIGFRKLLAAKDKEIEEMKDEFARTLNSGKKMYEMGKIAGAKEALKATEVMQRIMDLLKTLKADTPEEKQ